LDKGNTLPMFLFPETGGTRINTGLFRLFRFRTARGTSLAARCLARARNQRQAKARFEFGAGPARVQLSSGSGSRGRYRGPFPTLTTIGGPPTRAAETRHSMHSVSAGS
jgi:hypothetical protein